MPSGSTILESIFRPGELAIPATQLGHYLRLLAFGSAIPVFNSALPFTHERTRRPGAAGRAAHPRRREVLMLGRILVRFVKPYWLLLLGVVIFQAAQSIASLWLPSLNADIIDRGVAKGDIGYILQIGAIMLAVTLGQIICAIVAVYFGAKLAMAFGRDLRGAIFEQVGKFSEQEVSRFGAPSLITRTTNDVQQVQMLVLIGCTMLVATPILAVGGVIFAIGEDPGLSWIMVVAVPGAAHRGRPDHRAHDAAVPQDAGAHRRRQPGAARAAHRHPGRACLRARAGRDGPVRGSQRRTDRDRAQGRAAVRPDVPGRLPRAQPLERRRAVVRRVPHRRRQPADRVAHRVPELPRADPDGRADGEHAGVLPAACRGVVRPHRRSSRHAVERRAAAQPGDRADGQRRDRPARREFLLPRSRGARAARPRLRGDTRARRPRSSAAPEPARRPS